MKVSASIRRAYELQIDIQHALGDRVKHSLGPHINETWHFEGRVKQLESYALKLETGLVNAFDLDDFYACTIVVPTMSVIDEAEELVSSVFDTVSRKPDTNKTAMGGALDFRFDHLRIYSKLRVPLGLEAGPIHDIRFEVQIKTYLQHAWSIATHDLTYKTSDLSWGKERVAAQVKATLEAAEVSIAEAENLASSGNRLLTREDATTAELTAIARALLANFTTSQLPVDVKRLSSSARTLLTSCGIDPRALEEILRRGKTARGGSHPSNHSPFGILVLYLTEQQPAKLRRALKRRAGPKLFIPDEVSLPPSYAGYELLNMRTISSDTPSPTLNPAG